MASSGFTRNEATSLEADDYLLAETTDTHRTGADRVCVTAGHGRAGPGPGTAARRVAGPAQVDVAVVAELAGFDDAVAADSCARPRQEIAASSAVKIVNAGGAHGARVRPEGAYDATDRVARPAVVGVAVITALAVREPSQDREYRTNRLFYWCAERLRSKLSHPIPAHRLAGPDTVAAATGAARARAGFAIEIGDAGIADASDALALANTVDGDLGDHEPPTPVISTRFGRKLECPRHELALQQGVKGQRLIDE